MSVVLYIFFGLLAGVFGGMGMGGGTILIPLLTIFLGVSQKIAQGYNLFSFLLMAIGAIIIHTKNNLINLKSIWLLVLFGIAFCIGGAFLTKVIDTKILKIIFSCFLVLLGIFELVSAFISKKIENKK